MLPIAGQTAGPNGLNIFVDTHGWPGGVFRLKMKINFPRATPGPSASYFIMFFSENS